jgi:hypothetical protein
MPAWKVSFPPLLPLGKAMMTKTGRMSKMFFAMAQRLLHKSHKLGFSTKQYQYVINPPNPWI